MRESKPLKLKPCEILSPLANENELPEHRLYLAILEQAIIDLTSNSREASNIQGRRSARFWLLFSPLDDMRPLSYAWVCESLGINAERLRTLLEYAINKSVDLSSYRLFGRSHNMRGAGDHTKKH